MHTSDFAVRDSLDNMRFSVIVPIYNVEEYLSQCIESVLRQTFSDFELILVDDGSPDNSIGICNEYAQADSRVRVVRRKNGGLSAARNTGIQNARGDYLVFLDSDDYWINKNGLELIDRVLSRKNVEAVFWLYRKVRDRYNEFADGIPDDFSAEYTDSTGLIPYIRGKRLAACAWDLAVSRTLFENGTLDFEEGVYSEDVEWISRLIRSVGNYAFTNFVFNAYRLRDDSITKSIGEKNLDDLNSHYQRILDYIESSDADTANVLKAYLGEQSANYVLALSLCESDVIKKYKDCKTLRYIRFCVTKRSKLIKASVDILGVSGTAFLIKRLVRHQ